MLLSFKYFANSNSFLFEKPTSCLHFSSLMCFISSNIKSVKLNSSLISSVKSTIPEVSIAKCKLYCFNFLNKFIKNFACNSGSPPLTVTPPVGFI